MTFVADDEATLVEIVGVVFVLAAIGTVVVTVNPVVGVEIALLDADEGDTALTCQKKKLSRMLIEECHCCWTLTWSVAADSMSYCLLMLKLPDCDARTMEESRVTTDVHYGADDWQQVRIV